MYILLGLINASVGYGVRVQIPLCLVLEAAHILGFLIAPLCGILSSGHPYSFLCILSWILGYLCVVVVGIKYY